MFSKFIAFLDKYWPQVVFGTAALLHLVKKIEIDVYVLALLLLAFMPKLLPLIRQHFKRIEIGDLVSLDLAGTVDTDKEHEETVIAPPAIQPSVADIVPRAAKNEFGIERTRALATLWYYQKLLYGKASSRRWGIIPAEDNYLLKCVLASLRVAGLVGKAQNGLFYLSDEGIADCERNDVELTKHGPYYTKFAPLPQSGEKNVEL